MNPVKHDCQHKFNTSQSCVTSDFSNRYQLTVPKEGEESYGSLRLIPVLSVTNILALAISVVLQKRENILCTYAVDYIATVQISVTQIAS